MCLNLSPVLLQAAVQGLHVQRDGEHEDHPRAPHVRSSILFFLKTLLSCGSVLRDACFDLDLCAAEVNKEQKRRTQKDRRKTWETAAAKKGAQRRKQKDLSVRV